MPTFEAANDGAPLTRRVTSDKFPQQGQVDWATVSKSTISFSVGVLARLSAASIDPYTVPIGHWIGSSFHLSKTGRRNLEQALNNLHSCTGFGDALWFGFGIKHVVRGLSTTEQGATLVALCASLIGCFPQDDAAEVLAHLAKRTVDRGAPFYKLAQGLSLPPLSHCVPKPS